MLLALALIFTLPACGGKEKSNADNPSATAGSDSSTGNTGAKTADNTNSGTGDTTTTTAPVDKTTTQGDTKQGTAPEQPTAKVSLPILYYHAIDDAIEGIEELFVSPSEFEKQMSFLKQNNYTVITFDDLGNLKNIKKPVIITFDDGYEDNYTYAYPILKKYNFKATIFLVTNFIDNSSILKQSQIKEIAGLINFQSHTLSHADLNKLKDEEIEKELSESKSIIENMTGTKVNTLAYPTGYYDQRVIDIAKKYYKYAVVNGGGLYTEGDNNYELKRVYIPRNLDIKGFEQKITGGK